MDTRVLARSESGDGLPDEFIDPMVRVYHAVDSCPMPEEIQNRKLTSKPKSRKLKVIL